MAHAASTYKRIPRDGTRDLNLFSPRVHAVGRWAIPLVLGLIYGCWAATNRRYGGPITTGNLVFGFVTALVFAVLMAGILMLAPRLRREMRALLWFAFSGAALGFLLSQTSHSPLFIVVLSLLTGAAVGLGCLYWFSMHEDAQGNRPT
ncbi:hypothetical protein [Streptomyces thermoalcalitolerans]|uniref:Integral membrane protein n=1 Tax=Streptomyces thermoalcalitolerans TaxID=65605 RepID=A0ABN1ND98_9ACTN